MVNKYLHSPNVPDGGAAPRESGVPGPWRVNRCDRPQWKGRIDWEKPFFCSRWGPALLAPLAPLPLPVSSHPPLPGGAPGPWCSQAPPQWRSRGEARTPSCLHAEARGAAAGCVNGQAGRVAPETLRCIHRRQKSEGVISYLPCLSLPNFKNKNPSHPA